MCWHLKEKNELQMELDQLVAKRDELAEKKDDVGEIVWDFETFIREGQGHGPNLNPESIKIARSIVTEKEVIYNRLKNKIK